MKKFLILAVLFTAYNSFASVECPANYPSGVTLTYSDGSMNFPSGNTLRYRDGSMNYPSGKTLRYGDGSMDYPSGKTLRYRDGSMDYLSGNTLRYSDGSLNDSNGRPNTTGSVSLSTEFGDSKMKILVRPNSAKFQITIPYGSGIVLVDFDENGNVVCTVEGGNGPSEFRVDGNRGSAYVTVKQGQDPKAVKAAIQSALDGF